MSTGWSVEGSVLLAWRRRQLVQGGRGVDLDWLLDLGGGLAWSDMQRLHIDGSQSIALDRSLDELEILWCRHLETHVPLQHLVARCPWRDMLLEVSSDALIPRQETELLLDLVEQLPMPESPQVWADLGTGSGAIAIALARLFPEASGHAVDSSAEALALCSRNISRLLKASKCCLHRGSWWEPLRPWWGRLDLVLSNPPYIPDDQLESLDPVVRDHEPRLALDGGSDGLFCIRQLIASAGQALAPGGWLLLEHHHDQSIEVQRLMLEGGLVDVSPAADLQGIMRFAQGRRAPAGGSPGLDDDG